jgi:hypothetical protein
MKFVGREDYFRWLDEQYSRVSESQGRFLALRGRRQVGKSRLVTEWLSRRVPPYIYYQALDRPLDQELASFAGAVARSNIGPLSEVVASGVVWPSWEAAFDIVSAAGAGGPLGNRPAVVVLDELPYLVANDSGFEGTLQAAWDHKFQHTGVMLIVVGSDLAMMEALTGYGRPLYQRAIPKSVEPLNPAEVADLLGCDATDALDNYLMVGGLPKVVAARAEHSSRARFLAAATSDEAHPLVFTGSQMLNAEFPPQHAPRKVLEAIGAGERAFTTIRTRAAVSQRTLANALDLLATKHVISREDPRSARPISNRTRYVVADPYLRFWLRFLATRDTDIARGRGDLVAADIESSWQSYTGAAIEPVVRAAIDRILPDRRFGASRYVGSYWTRDHQTEVDLVGTEQDRGSRRVEFVGSVKWRTRKSFGTDDVTALAASALEVPGWETTSLKVGVSRTGFTKDVALDVMLDPEDVLAAWQ